MSSPRDGNYVVGKGRPPHGSRWKAGQTGNPKGRPKGKKDLLAYIADALRRTIKMKEAGAFRNVTVRKAIAMRMANQALMGDPKFISLIMAISKTNSLMAEREIVVWKKRHDRSRGVQSVSKGP
jgi:hypothetical protein